MLVAAPSATEAGSSGSITVACVCGWSPAEVAAGPGTTLAFFCFQAKKYQDNKIDPDSVIKGVVIYFKIYSC